MTNKSGRTFLLKLQSLRPDDETTRNLRWLLKKTLRQLGFCCIDLREESQDDRTSTPTSGGSA
jgi:hypothetical protein